MYVVVYEKRNHFVHNMIFCHLHVQTDSQWFPRRSPKSPSAIGYIFTALGTPETVTIPRPEEFSTWFVGSLGLLLHRSNAIEARTSLLSRAVSR